MLVLSCQAKAPTSSKRPAFCDAAVATLKSSQTVVPARDVPPLDAASAETLAVRMKDESDALGALSEEDAVRGAADAADGVSAAAAALAVRKKSNANDVASTERALALVLRERERAVFVLRSECGELVPPFEQSAEWQKRATEVVSSVTPRLRSCVDGIPEEQRPAKMQVLAQIDPKGRVMLATPVDVTFELARWGPSDVAHCVVRQVEETTFPEPSGTATVVVPFAAQR